MWRFTHSDGITEGFHNKTETITGFHGLQNYRQQVQVLCA
jgi:hypothetical protein